MQPPTPPQAPTPPVTPPTVPGQPDPNAPKKSNKGLIIGLVVGGSLLALLMLGGLFVLVFIVRPTLERQAAKESASQSKATAKSTDSTKKVATNCLTLDDYKSTYPSVTKNYDELLQDNEIETVFFLADSTEYQYPNTIDDLYDRIAAFMKQNSSKKFTVHLEGSVNGDNGQAGGGVLSTQRAEKVRDALIAKGADASKLIVDPPAVYDQGENPSEFYQSVFRNVGVIVHDDCLPDDKQ